MQIDISEITVLTRDRNTSIRLYRDYRKQYRNQSPEWVVQKIIQDLERDRRVIRPTPFIRTRPGNSYQWWNWNSRHIWTAANWRHYNRLCVRSFWVGCASQVLARLQVAYLHYPQPAYQNHAEIALWSIAIFAALMGVGFLWDKQQERAALRPRHRSSMSRSISRPHSPHIVRPRPMGSAVRQQPFTSPNQSSSGAARPASPPPEKKAVSTSPRPAGSGSRQSYKKSTYEPRNRPPIEDAVPIRPIKPQDPPPQEKRTVVHIPSYLWNELNTLTRDPATSQRLIKNVCDRNPGRSIEWVVERAIWEIERDRR